MDPVPTCSIARSCTEADGRSFDAGGNSSPSPDCPQRGQQLLAPTQNLRANIGLESARFWIFGSRIEIYLDEAPRKSSETVSPFPFKDYKYGNVQWQHLRFAEYSHPGRPFGDCTRKKVGLDSHVIQVVEEQNRLPWMSSDAMRFSSSSAPPPAVTAWGSRPNAMKQIQRASRPFPEPAPDIAAARTSTPGARCRLGRHTAVNSATRKEESRHGPVVYSDPQRPHQRRDRVSFRNQQSRTF